METENILAKNIAAAGDKAAYDAACKRLLGNKAILAWIMKSCLEEYRDYEAEEIAEKYIEGDPWIAKEAVNPDEGADNGKEQIRGANARRNMSLKRPHSAQQNLEKISPYFWYL